MPALRFNHEEVQKGLNLLTDTVKTLNDRRVELELVSEQLRDAVGLKEKVQARKLELDNQIRLIEERLSLLELLSASKERELEYLTGKVSRHELQVLSEKNLTTVERNKLYFLHQIRDKTNKELKQLETDITKNLELKKVTDQELDNVSSQISDIRFEAAESHKSLDQKAQSLAYQLGQLALKERQIDEKNEQLHKYQTRLEKLTKELGLDIKL